jgi:hypothetical protein
VRRWIASGKLRAIGCGRLTRVRVSDAAEFENVYLRERPAADIHSETQQIRHSHARVRRPRAKR